MNASVMEAATKEGQRGTYTVYTISVPVGGMSEPIVVKKRYRWCPLPAPCLLLATLASPVDRASPFSLCSPP